MSVKKTETETAPPAIATEQPAAPKKSKRIPIEEYLARLADNSESDDLENSTEDSEGPGKIVMILRLFTQGYSRKEIISAGYNKSTVYRQTGEFMKLKKAPALKMHGFELYEARVQRLMARKNLSRNEAVEIIAEKDNEL